MPASGLWLPNRRLAEIYNYYRLVLSLSLAVAVIGLVDTEFMEHFSSVLYKTVSYSYLFTALILTAVMMSVRRIHLFHMVTTVTIDILFLTLLMYASGGINSGLGNLIIITVACGNIMTTGRLGLLIASIATIATLYMEFYLQLQAAESASGYLQAGFQGVMYFGTSIFVQQITKRMAESEGLAQRRAKEILNLEKLNQMIIQRMRTGIIVCSENGQMHMVNAAAKELMPVSSGAIVQEDKKTTLPGYSLKKPLPAPLDQYLQLWLEEQKFHFETFPSVGGHAEVRSSFARLTSSSDEILVFLEDASRLKQEAQQLKLASLGRLTASIAHEIRNPLGAISHASQLLQESEQLDRADKKLTDIIQNHCIRVNKIIENVLQLSRRKLEASDTIKLKPWLEHFAETIREEMLDARISLTSKLSNSMSIQFVESQLEQVITNLVSNGLRYSVTHNGSATIDLVIDIDETTRQPILDVIDDGPGINESSANQLFEPFYTTDTTGTGLGLFISKELCELNQAQLEYYKHETRGSVFRISFAHSENEF